MAMDLRRDPRTWNGALERVGEQLAVHPETLRNWVAQAEVDAGERPGTTTSDAQRPAEPSGRTGDRGARTRSCAARRLSSRRSSSAHNGDRLVISTPRSQVSDPRTESGSYRNARVTASTTVTVVASGTGRTSRNRLWRSTSVTRWLRP